MRGDLAVFVTQEHLPGFMTDAFGPQPATEGMALIPSSELSPSVRWTDLILDWSGWPGPMVSLSTPGSAVRGIRKTSVKPGRRSAVSVYFPPCRGSSSPFTELHGQGGLHPEDTVPGWLDPGGIRTGGFRCPFGGSGLAGRVQSRGSTSPATMASSHRTIAGEGWSHQPGAGKASSLSPTQKSAHPPSAIPP